MAYVSACLIIALLTPPDNVELEPFLELLKSKGLVKSGTVFIAKDEATLATAIRGLERLRRQQIEAQKKLTAVEATLSDNRKTIETLIAQRQQLDDLLSRTRDIPTQNQIIGRANSIATQINKLRSYESSSPEVKQARDADSKSRENFILELAKTRELVEQMKKNYSQLQQDGEIMSALDNLRKADPKSDWSLGPSRTIGSRLRAFEKMESLVQSEKITLKPSGGVFLIEVVLNAKVVRPFVLDSGASLVCLPGPLAAEAGLQSNDKDPSIRLSIANGDVIEAKLVKIGSLRVGQFVAENVECAVLPPEYRNADPLLGGSFLKHFNYQIDPANATLQLTRLGADDTTKSDGRNTSKKKAP